MLRRSRYLVACCGAAFGLISFLIGLEVSATTAALLAEQGSIAINRALKADRLPLVQSLGRNGGSGPTEMKPAQPPVRTPELLVGCEPIVSSIGQPPLARVAGRCLS
jgi:hypothetical protein